jgi:phosphatidylinositol alpha-mannosyltransferase
LVFDDSLDSADGVAQHVKTLGAWLSRRGHKVSYLVGETKLKEWQGGQVFSLAKNRRVNFNGNRLSIPLPANSNNIRKVIDAQDFDILHVMMPHSPLMAQRVVNRADPQTAVIGTFHIYPSGALVNIGSRFLRRMYGNGLRRFSMFISVSSAAAEFAKRAYGIKSEVLPNPVDLSAYRTPSAVKRDNNSAIVFLGRLVKRKGCRQLLEAFAVLHKSNPAASLVIAGDGPQRRQLEELSRRLGVADSVKFLGFIAEEDKPSLLASADIACFPSLFGESFGIVLVEAMAAGSGVVVGGDNPGYRTILGAQPQLLVDPLDKQAFAGRLRSLLRDKALRSKLHSWQDKEVKKYDIETVGPQLVRIYFSAIARSKKTGHNNAYE